LIYQIREFFKTYLLPLIIPTTSTEQIRERVLSLEPITIIVLLTLHLHSWSSPAKAAPEVLIIVHSKVSPVESVA